MEHLPIIIVHCGNSFYLEPILRQNRYFNPDNRICLISDKSTSRIAHAEHFLIDDYMSSAKEFQKIYRHYSVNTVAFELFCFQRWFCVLDFIKDAPLPLLRHDVTGYKRSHVRTLFPEIVTTLLRFLYSALYRRKIPHPHTGNVRGDQERKKDRSNIRHDRRRIVSPLCIGQCRRHRGSPPQAVYGPAPMVAHRI